MHLLQLEHKDSPLDRFQQIKFELYCKKTLGYKH
jgi:hypothetical protein